MSEPIRPAPAAWRSDPLLSGRAQVPQFLRTQWDEAHARQFGPWRVAAALDPASGQSVGAFTPQAPSTDPEPVPAPLPTSEPTEDAMTTEPSAGSAWSDQAIAALKEDAWAQGLAQGLQQARQEHEAARQKEGEILRHLGIELRSLQQSPQRFFEPLKRLALHIAEQWVRGELHLSGQVVDQLIRQCLEQLDPAGEKVHVDLHPADLQRLQALGESATADLELHADAQLREGSVRVRVNDSVVQDLIEHRLETMARKLLQSPEAWLQHSALLHPDRATPLPDSPSRRPWAQTRTEVQDVNAIEAMPAGQAVPHTPPDAEDAAPPADPTPTATPDQATPPDEPGTAP